MSIFSGNTRLEFKKIPDEKNEAEKPHGSVSTRTPLRAKAQELSKGVPLT
jgi:hypothetical protein